MKAIKQTLLALALGGAFTNANAIPVDWTLSNIKYADERETWTDYKTYFEVSGSFTYDADTGVFSNVNLVNVFNFETSKSQYGSAATSITGSANQISFFAGTSIAVSFASALGNAGGTVLLASGTLGTCCSLAPDQSITGTPRVPATAVPEPEAYAMMLAGLGLVGFAARRKLS